MKRHLLLFALLLLISGAMFGQESYLIEVSANPSNGGTVTGGGSFPADTTITIRATPNSGYQFIKWMTGDGIEIQEPEHSFTVTQDSTFVAYFALNQNSHTLSINYKYTDGTQAAPTYTDNVNYGDPYSVASPTITGYTPDIATVSGTMPDHDVTVDVTYNVNSYTLTINYKYANGATAATSHVESLNYGASYSVTSPSITGYTPNLEVVSGTMGAEDVTVDVTYNINSYTLTINYLYADGTTAAASHTESVNYNVSYSVTSPTITGYTPDIATVSGTMPDHEVTVDVTYNINSYTISVSASPSNGGEAYVGNNPNSQQGTYNYGEECTVHARTNSGYIFEGWLENGQQVFTDLDYTFRVEGIRTLEAKFAQQHTVTVLALPEEGGNPYIGNTPGTTQATFTHGQSCTVHANLANGYSFLKWTVNGNQVTTNANFTFTVNDDCTLIANYQPLPFTISVSADPSNGGTVTGGGGYNYGENCTLRAINNSGFAFENWTENDSVVSTYAEYQFTVTCSRTLVAHFTALPPDTYSINVSANPNNGGSPYIGNTPGTTQAQFTSGQSCTVHANHANGYTFVKWTENGNQVSQNANYTFTVNANRNLVANFQAQTYTISVSGDPTNGGAPYIGNTPGTTQATFTHGQSCTVHANHANGYEFANWTVNGGQVSTNANYTFTVTSNRTLVAHFTAQAPNTYTITATADPANGGSVTGGGTYEQGATCTLTATPNTGYDFVNWKKGEEVVSTNSTHQFQVTVSAAYVAHFRLKSFTINVSADPSNGGTVSGGGTYDFGQSCTLSATPNSNYVFEKWTKNGTQVSDNPTFTFPVTGDASYVAHFKKKACTIKVSANPTNGGSVYIGDTPGTTQATYNYGEICIVHARANTDFTFINWTEDDYQVNTHADYSFTVEGDRTLVAKFADASACIIYVDIEPEIGGTVTGAGVYSPGDVCTLKAFAKVGYEFKNWTINDVEVSTELSYTFTVTGTEYYVAHFEEKKYTITATSNNEDWGTVTGGGNYNYGGNCTLKATAKSGCTFSHWMKDDNTIIIENPYTFVVWDAASFTAIFELESTQQYTITATANPEEGGTVTGGGTYASGVTCKLKATPNTGYTFINWTEDGTAVSSNATYTFPVTNDRNLIANFEKDEVPCIENDKIQKIVPKDHTENNETYTLILVYPNPDEEYVYQWCYAPETDSLHYRDLNVNDGTYNKQYFYRGGALLKGYYKVRISKEKGGCSPVETEPHHVTYKHATQLRIYPNPSRRDHNIVVVNDSDGPSQLSIYSTDGRLLHAQTVTDNQTTLNLNLPSGVYIAYLTDSDGYTKIGKLVIQ